MYAVVSHVYKCKKYICTDVVRNCFLLAVEIRAGAMIPRVAVRSQGHSQVAIAKSLPRLPPKGEEPVLSPGRSLVLWSLMMGT